MSRRITIDPVTRLEGHGKIEILLDERGEVSQTYLQVPELRGFERFCLGRAAEEMPTITAAICGVCPASHHLAATRALDALYGVEPPPAAHAVRELFYNLFIFEDHLLHFFFLGGPDLLVGRAAPAEARNILGVVGKVGAEAAQRFLAVRREAREIMTAMAGRVIHPVFGVPGGVSKPLEPELVERIRRAAPEFVALALATLDLFRKKVLTEPSWQEALEDPAHRLTTHSMGLVDEKLRVAFARGTLRVMDPAGGEFARFGAAEYPEHIQEHVEDWSYVKFPFLKAYGWKGFDDAPGSGLYRVGPLARLNAAEAMRTRLAQEHREEMFDALGGRPCHHTPAFHWARLVEVLQAAETVLELSQDPLIASPEVRALPSAAPAEGVGVVEAPRGTLLHHYRTDGQGILTFVNLLVATVHNSAPIQLSVRRTAASLIHEGKVDDGLLNGIEMAFRAYDPCFACATHALPGGIALTVEVRDASGAHVRTLSRRAPEGP